MLTLPLLLSAAFLSHLGLATHAEEAKKQFSRAGKIQEQIFENKEQALTEAEDVLENTENKADRKKKIDEAKKQKQLAEKRKNALEAILKDVYEEEEFDAIDDAPKDPQQHNVESALAKSIVSSQKEIKQPLKGSGDSDIDALYKHYGPAFYNDADAQKWKKTGIELDSNKKVTGAERNPYPVTDELYEDWNVWANSQVAVWKKFRESVEKHQKLNKAIYKQYPELNKEAPPSATTDPTPANPTPRTKKETTNAASPSSNGDEENKNGASAMALATTMLLTAAIAL